MKLRMISVIGPNSSGCSPGMYSFGVDLGVFLAQRNWGIVCGGMGGMMEAVCKGAKSEANCLWGATVGILPGEIPSEANPYCDIVIPTGMGIARNKIVVNAGEAVIAVAGGAGTLSEIALAWQLGKPILCIANQGGWSQRMAELNMDLDTRRKGLISYASTFGEIETWLHER